MAIATLVCRAGRRGDRNTERQKQRFRSSQFRAHLQPTFLSGTFGEVFPLFTISRVKIEICNIVVHDWVIRIGKAELAHTRKGICQSGSPLPAGNIPLRPILGNIVITVFRFCQYTCPKAASILEFHPFLVPSLLQTADYATAVMRAGTPWEPPAKTEASVRERTARGERFQSADTPVMMVVIGRAVLTEPIDHGPIMRGQLEHIHALAARERITLQITEEPLHPGLVGPFTILDPPPERELVYAESAYKGQFVHDPDAVGEFKLRFHRLQAAAMPPSRSLRLVEETIEGFPP
ncbi:DUF5753 domain-containing protein [Nocardiopsis alborubida]|nr:DUF5753 domain-containing protein [Nocardiopsis alborubida]